MFNWSLNYVSFTLLIPFIYIGLSDMIYESPGTIVLVTVMMAMCGFFLIRSIYGIAKHEHAAPLALMTSLYSVIFTMAVYFS